MWGKKLDRDAKLKGAEAASAEAQKRRRAEQLRELEKAKLAREQREREKEEWEAEKLMLEREREQMAYVENEKREEEFELRQTALRARIRVGEGRGKPVDIVSESLALLSADIDAEIAAQITPHDPLHLFRDLNPREMRELHAEICRRAQLDADFRPFWSSMRVLCEHEETAAAARGAPGGSSGLHTAVTTDVSGLFAGKSADELDALDEQVSAQLAGDDDIDVDYWQTVQRELQIARARASIHEAFERMKARKAELAPPEEADATLPAPTLADALDGAADVNAVVASGRYSPELFDDDDDDEAGGGGGMAGEGEVVGSGRYSPPLLTATQVASERVVDPEEDRKALLRERDFVRARAQERRAGDTPAGAEVAGASSSGAAEVEADGSSELVDAEARRGMEQGEARFSFEVPLERKVTWWHDKYRPRKPKYFNRVHTGYEWNKYNQTHYDHDNPPPKMVQGYKFAIFYPDLIDRTQTPTYQLLPDPSGAKDTCLLRFRGGPPYEDIAFKIVNNEWEHSHKRGFRCRFERGILQLHFGFKRHRYRR